MPFPEQPPGRWPMLEQIEQQETREQLTVPQLEIASSGPVPVFENDQRQRRRMVIALVMLLVALGLVLVKDRDFWFPAPDFTESEAVDDSTPTDTSSDTAASAASTSATPSVPVRRKKSHPAVPPVAKSVVAETPVNPVVPAARVARPPLRVEVVAGGQHRAGRTGRPPGPAGRQ